MASFGKVPEKSNFAQTCNLLSQFLKGKGTLGMLDTSKGPESWQTPTTLNLLPRLENLPETSRPKETVTASANVKSAEFFPQFSGFASQYSAEDKNPDKADLRKTAQMTIFYGGKVIVFNDFPSDKAKEIMDLAMKGSPNSSHNTFLPSSSSGADKINSTTNVSVPADSNNAQEPLQLKPEVNGSDLPIARRASLHRFLKKRNERVAARGPYQRDNAAPSPPKPDQENIPWLDLNQS